MASSRPLKKVRLLRCARSPREFVFVIRVRARPDFTTTSSRSRSRYRRASHLNLFDQPGISCIALLVQLEAPRGRIAASNSTNFMCGTEVSLQTFRILISSVGLFQSLFDSQVTCTQVVFFSQEHTFSERPAASSSSVRYKMLSFSLPCSKCTPGTSV